MEKITEHLKEERRPLKRIMLMDNHYWLIERLLMNLDLKHVKNATVLINMEIIYAMIILVLIDVD